ncbi:MAG: farnesyl diphosphate synthase, partial [Merdibacter sp.]|nr:farnesyl diphosphate synthase [Merdibacter sp.]
FYSLLAGGKRVRPRLLFETVKGYGMPEKSAFPCAAAIEMIHTYSLIHDDLPAMDNDDMRRGRPTCHIAFDEATAVLAGDALLTEAFRVALQSSCDSSVLVQIISLLSEYAGVDGMILGQTLDIAGEKRTDLTQQELEQIHRFKTGRLLTLPLLCGALLCNHAEDVELFKQIGEKIGLSFQIQDDVMDVTLSQTQLGKSTSDEQNNKFTYVTLLGIDRAAELADAYYNDAEKLCQKLHCDTTGLLAFLKELKNRRS